MLPPNDWAPIDFARECERDFASAEGGFDFSIGEELTWRMARREADLHLFPDWVEAIAGDGIDHGNKRLVSWQAGVRLVDEVEGGVVLKQGPFSGRREFHELDIEQVAVVISGYYAGRTVRAPGTRTGHERECQGCPNDDFENMLHHRLACLELR